jgi:hypothetical protein
MSITDDLEIDPMLGSFCFFLSKGARAMKTILKASAILAVMVAFLAPKTAQAQVSVGIATPGFALGVGPGYGYGYAGGGYYPGYVAAPIYAPRPIVVAPPIYGRPIYGGGYYGRPGYGYGRPGPYYGPGRVYRR